MPPKRKDVGDTAAQEGARAAAMAMIPQRATPSELRAVWGGVVAGEYFCREIVDGVVEAMEEEIVRTHMDHTSVPWTVQSILTDLMEAMQLNFVEREGSGGFSDEEFDAGYDVHVDVAEPETMVADSWSRASMLHRRPLVSKERASAASAASTAAAAASSGAAAAPGSRGASGASRSGAGRASPSPTDGAVSVSASGRAASQSSHARRKRVPSAVVGAGAAAQVMDGKSPAKGGGAAPPATATSQDAAEEDRQDALDDATGNKTEEDLQLLTEIEQQRRQMEQLRCESSKVHKQLTELKNPQHQSIVVDGATSSVLLVSPPDLRSLPPTIQEVKVVSADEAAAAAAATRAHGASSRRLLSTPLASRGKKQQKRAPAGPASFWEPESELPPMISGVAPTPGVTTREGDVIRRVDLKPQKLRMTRSEYTKHAQMQQAAPPPTLPNTELDDPAPTAASGPATKPIPMPASEKASAQQQQQSSIVSTGARAASAAPTSVAPASGGTVPRDRPRVAAATPQSISATSGLHGKLLPQGVAELPRSRATTPALGSRATTPVPTISPARGSANAPRRGDAHSPNNRHIHPIMNHVHGGVSSMVAAGSGARGARRSRPSSSVNVSLDLDDDVARDFVESVQRQRFSEGNHGNSALASVAFTRLDVSDIPTAI